jgi:hemoglobin
VSLPPAPGAAPTPDQEAAVERMVRLFYRNGLADPVLAPIFQGAIHDWESHIRLVADFWSNSIHGTRRYKGNAYAPHMKLRFEPEAFEHWLAAFEAAAAEALGAVEAARAIGVARHMAQSYRAGLFPFRDANGRPSRTPPPPLRDPSASR